MTIIYRPEQRRDVAAIHAVNRAAFPTEAEARLVDALRGSGRLLISLVADDTEKIVGHIGFSPVMLSSAPDSKDGIGLAPMSVIPGYQRQGIGSRLVRDGLVTCKNAGFKYVVVLGDPDYYGRFGFVRASVYGLGNEYGVYDEFMALAIQPDGIPTTPAVVSYAPEFALVE